MAANPDHIRRDAEHAARMEITLVLAKFQRRMYEQAKANIASAIADAGPDSLIDGTQIGRDAATSAANSFISGEPLPAVESGELAAAPGIYP